MEKYSIPKHIVEHHKKGVENVTFYGFSAAELNHDELLALVNVLATELKEQRERLLAIPTTLRYEALLDQG